MKFKKIISFLIIPFLIIFLSGCVVNKDGKMVLKKNEPFKHDTPLIKTDVKKLGKKELEKSAEMGPTPVEGCLLYTSPSPRDTRSSRMPSSA